MQGSLSGSVLPGASTRSFWLFLPPLSSSKHTLCFIFSVVLPSQQESATVVNALPKSIHFDKKRLAHSRRHELFFIITDLVFFSIVFCFILINTIYVSFPVSRTHKRTVQTQVFTNQGRGVNLLAHKLS